MNPDVDPSQAAAPQGQQAAPAICIAPQGDGSFMVYAEGSAPEGEPMPLDAALDQARSMLGGPEGASDGKAEGEALFQSAFDKTRGIPLNRT